MSLLSALQKRRNVFARVARLLLGAGLAMALVSVLTGIVPISTVFAVQAPPLEHGVGRWWLTALTGTLLCYLFASMGAVTAGVLLGGLTARRGARVLQHSWYNGAIGRGLELTGALPNVILCVIWSSSHPGQALPALLVVTVVQQVFEVAARVKALIEAPDNTWRDFWHEVSKSASQTARTLASGEIALILLKLTPMSYATWPSSLASYLYEEPDGVTAVFFLALLGTVALPALVFFAGPARPAVR